MTPILRRGSRGADVAALQRDLNSAGARPALVIDSVFAGQTGSAVRSFQVRHGLIPDGIAGPHTLAALAAAIAPIASGRPEPDKGAMALAVPDASVPSEALAVRDMPALDLVKTARPIDEIIIHCAATPAGRDFTVDDIRAWHKARGWSDIGYHYVVYRDGRVVVGRPVGQVGAHCEGHNTGTIGISYVGGVSSDGKRPEDTRTDAQRAALLWLVRQLLSLYPAIRTVSGHNQYAAKACPSFDVRRDALGRLV